mmetsp:Transcript_1841/g.2938  ORF Transcript_1841/g.2938 Transcript_1841/m.2938 type:complete len:300 (+) Transcript_1841:154-1053(+)
MASGSSLEQDLDVPPIYHEKQYGSMCGQHCLNNLLQGPYFQAEDLADIASELDKLEQALVPNEKIESSNIDDAGNFSVQVLATALEKSNDLMLDQDPKTLSKVLTSLSEADECSENLEDVAFVCNLRAHWFAVRSIRGQVWNLNSLKRRPEKISLFYLSAFLGQLREEGYSIFVVDGVLPPPMTDISLGRREDWFVFGVDDASIAPDPKRVSLHTQNSQEDALLQSALIESMYDDEEPRPAQINEDDELQQALELSMRMNPRSNAHQEEGLDEEEYDDLRDDDEETDIRRAMLMSLQER